MTTLEWFRVHKSSHPWAIKSLYGMLGISKQAHYKQVNKYKEGLKMEQTLIAKAISIRQDHPMMGTRKLYHLINPQGIGRDRFEALLFANGLNLKRKKNYKRTTYSSKRFHYPNLISGTKVVRSNQIWVSDITYIAVGSKTFYYLFLIQDIYNRKVVGWSLSDNLKADHLIEALKQAIKATSKAQLEGLIFHSDRGSQYLYGVLGRLQQKYGIITSMGNKAWENAHAESINGVLKGEYINFLTVNDLKQMKKRIKKIITLYNQQRPHGSLKMKTPKEFENFVQGLAPEQRPIFKVNY